MQGTIQLRTKRLLLRRTTLDDVEILYRELGCNPAMIRYTCWNPYDTLESARRKVENDIRDYDNADSYAWIIQAGNEVIGTIGAYGYDPEMSSIELGYSIFQKFWGQGFASEAAAEVVRYLIMDEGINRVHAWCHVDNAASAGVLTHAGMKQEGLLRQAMKNPDGTYADQKILGIVREDYTNVPISSPQVSFLPDQEKDPG